MGSRGPGVGARNRPHHGCQRGDLRWHVTQALQVIVADQCYRASVTSARAARTNVPAAAVPAVLVVVASGRERMRGCRAAPMVDIPKSFPPDPSRVASNEPVAGSSPACTSLARPIGAAISTRFVAPAFHAQGSGELPVRCPLREIMRSARVSLSYGDDHSNRRRPRKRDWSVRGRRGDAQRVMSGIVCPQSASVRPSVGDGCVLRSSGESKSVFPGANLGQELLGGGAVCPTVVLNSRGRDSHKEAAKPAPPQIARV